MVLHRDVLHLHLPVAGVRHGHPEEVAGHARGLVLPKGDLALLGVSGSEEDREHVFLQHLVADHAVQDVEVGPLGHLREAEPEDTVKGHETEGLVRFLGRCHEVAVRADAADADRVLDEDATDLAGAEGDRHHVAVAALVNRPVRAVGEGDVDRARGLRGVEALVGRARLVVARLRRQQQVSAARVEDDDELLRRGPDRHRAVVLASVRRLARRASALALQEASSAQGRSPLLGERGGRAPLELHRVRAGSSSRCERQCRA
mmetsp:Transcript_25003/g.63394  ORF Transcript_25003/g.63394 Transcript_25003/m.63394 type:complete len:261 (-) Transcript_25003:61-843(-)